MWCSILFYTLLITFVRASSNRTSSQTKVGECDSLNGNACGFVTCENGGQCNEDPSTADCFKCHCLPGFSGKVCQNAIILPPGCGSGCQNGGACIGNICNCQPGFTGPFCETINNCAPVNPCGNGGRCSSVGNTFVCDCTGTGFTGRDCTEPIVTNPCTTNPCQNGAQCSWNGVLVTCACVGGFSGSFCQIPPVPCAATPCENGGVCEPTGANTYGCRCPAEYTGIRCETYILSTHPCVTMADRMCQNGGECTVNGDDYLCRCASGWGGRNCEVREEPNTCNPNTCNNNGVCSLVQITTGLTAHCSCRDDWTGKYCDVRIGEQCYDGYCMSGGVCRTSGNIRYCECPVTHIGARCETPITGVTTTTAVPGVRPCSLAPCRNGGACYGDNVNFICVCPPNWTDRTCSTAISVVDLCSPKPCRNNGACQTNGMVFVCTCIPPWTGLTCESYQPAAITTTTAIPTIGMTCTDMPCRNGGVCYTIANGYYCYCGANNLYTGKNCETIVPVTPSNCPLNCAPGYCVPSGSSARPYVFVRASSNWTSSQTKVGECDSLNGNACGFVTCENGGQCNEDPSTADCFKCHCLPGFSGKVCQNAIILPPGCGSGCQNGGACIGNICNCQPGFTGPFCETINNCAPVNPCGNGGRCSSVGNTFVCDCTGTGFTGRDCTEPIVTNPCTTNPCQNGAQCSWNGVLVTCACVGGFSGSFCQIPPVPCAATPCENGGVCEPTGANTYGCRCPAEYTGIRCETYILSTHPCVTMADRMCQNGGECTVNGDDYLCRCASGWGGRNCEVREEPNTCNPNTCNNNGVCSLVQITTGLTAHCSCRDDWTGKYCDVRIGEQCYDGYCMSGGVCRTSGNIRYCECPATYTGRRCESLIGAGITTTTPVSPTLVPSVGNCSPSPCLNGGACFSDNNYFICLCTSPWSGRICEEGEMVTTTTVMTSTTTIPSVSRDCQSNPCQNGGTCVPIGTSYSCFCGLDSIYTGKNCDSTAAMSFLECPLNCAPGRCIFSGYAERPYGCLWNGIMRPEGGTTR
ncbi:unnamed protein product [Adineta ricciae]|uniref:EGF-like domain-containing protein n=1 Tax=Adineta ricciae TaxID=249248 RepID=A0A814ELJ5_ADIRI|nr:unnamed protein product [Adineta ricciae]